MFKAIGKINQVGAVKSFAPSLKGSLVSINQNNFTTSSVNSARKGANPTKNANEINWEFDAPEMNYKFDDHTTPAHQFLRQIRYVRSYLRKAKFELPKLKTQAKPFVPPTSTQYLQFMKVEHFGEEHQQDTKSVVIVDLERLEKLKAFTPTQTHKLILICQNNFFIEKNYLRFSSNKYPTYNENKLSLAKLWQRITAEVKDGKDNFADIPLPQIKSTSKLNRMARKELQFPKEWVA